MGEQTEAELKELAAEMRRRSHELSNILQAHTAELAVMRSLARQFEDLAKAIYGDNKSGTDTGLRGAVAHLTQAVRDTEWQRQQDREQERKQYSQMAAKLEQTAVVNERGRGAIAMVKEIAQMVTTVATAGGLMVAIYQLLSKGH